MGSDLKLTVRGLVHSYESKDRYINHLGCWMPKIETVQHIISLLKDVLFPGFRLEGATADNVEYRVGAAVDQIFHSLSDQIDRALKHPEVGQPCESLPGAPSMSAQQITHEFLSRLPEIRALLETDVEAAFLGDPACRSRAEVIFCYPGFEAITIHRLSHELYRLQVPFIPRMFSELAHRRTGIDIHPGARIGHHFFIDHGTGVVIGETCEIGDHCKIYQGVTLGALSFPTDAEGNLVRNQKRHPTLEDHVVIYANATVLGGNTVLGRKAVIGSSVWITSSVDPESSVVMEKPRLRIKSKETSLPVSWDYQI
ncbi:MAG: serine acetyltransferase [Planctomycetaceae bacterium]|nr:serine acetyltransferase [Planctomycetaceae bacterium]